MDDTGQRNDGKSDDEHGEIVGENYAKDWDAKIGKTRAIFATRDRSTRASRRKLKRKTSRGGVRSRIASNRPICCHFFLPSKVEFCIQRRSCV